jgi:hypothetical protein
MDRVVQQNASLVAEAAAATQHMADQAQELLQSVAHFKLDDSVHGDLAFAQEAPAEPLPAHHAPRMIRHNEGGGLLQ